MKTKLPLLLIFAIFLSACGMPSPIVPTSTPRIIPTEKPLPTVTPACISAEPVQADIDRALAYTGSMFETTDWERSYSVSENRVSVTWLNNVQGSVAYLEALIFPCGYEDLDLDEYFSDENWGVIFENYESYELADECETNGRLRLYVFDAVSQGYDYQIYYWVENDTATRVMVLMLTLPVEAENYLNEIAPRLFPNLPNCS